MYKVHYNIRISLGRYRVEEQGLGHVTVGKHGVRLHCFVRKQVEDGSSKLSVNFGSLKHILSGCKTSLT